ncbi:Ca(2+)-dependent cysteine protease [Tulasnella sp. 418]|nr:Ca(2+)-dependent cysteine protease [Tulasnella sp. 418]
MFFLNTISHLKATLFYVLYNCFLFRSISWILLQPLRRFGLARRPYALLIGIEQYKENGVWGQLPGARGDIRLYKEILTKGLGIHPYDIIVMNDFEFSPLSTFYPTRHNMEREIRKLGSSLRVGDLGFFSYSGHAKQLKEHAPSEADGMDEAIVPVDGSNEGENLIKDNELNSWLVAPLPAGATLLAACDASPSH